MTVPARRSATILGSFAYWAKHDLGKLTRRAHTAGVDIDFMADSGAFTAYTTGKKITVKQYATWLLAWAPYINCAMTLDVIGSPAGSARNTIELQEAVGDAVYVIPIFHVGSPWEELHRWCSSHPYVALGGGVAVGKREKAFIAWLIRCHQIAAEYGACLHGLGMTRPPYPDLLPFYSVDSSFWSIGSRSGSVTLFEPRRRRFVCVRNSNDTTRALARYAPLIRSYGGDPKELSVPGYGLVGQRGTERGRAERTWISRASAESWMRYADHLATRHHGLAAPDPVTGDGPKIYFAAGSVDDFDLIVDVTATRTITEEVPA